MSEQNLAEAFKTIVESRRSVRAYKSEPVTQEVLDNIFTLANRAPSNCNTQPWLTHVASGEKIEVLRERIPENMANGIVSFDYPYDGKYKGVYKRRQHDAAYQMYSALGIPREDKQRRMEAFFTNYSFFGAPHVAFLFMPENFGLREACDVGMYAQNLMLSMAAHGVASCPQTALGFHADLIREVLDIDPANKLLFGISFGYEDETAPVNNARTDRAEIADNTTFHQ